MASTISVNPMPTRPQNDRRIARRSQAHMRDCLVAVTPALWQV